MTQFNIWHFTLAWLGTLSSVRTLKGNEGVPQRIFQPSVFSLSKRRWLTTSYQCKCAVYYHSCPSCLTGEDVPAFRRCFSWSGAARSLSINKSDNCQCRQLFVTALLSWLTASCHSHRGKSEFYILWLPSGERRHLHMNQLSASLYSDNSLTAQIHRECCCAHFSWWHPKFVQIFFPVRWFKESGISRLYLSLWKQKCRNLQNYGLEQNRKVDETFFFF